MAFRSYPTGKFDMIQSLLTDKENGLRLNFGMESTFNCTNSKNRMLTRLNNADERKRIIRFTAILAEQYAASVPFQLKPTLLYFVRQ